MNASTLLTLHPGWNLANGLDGCLDSAALIYAITAVMVVQGVLRRLRLSYPRDVV